MANREKKARRMISQAKLNSYRTSSHMCTDLRNGPLNHSDWGLISTSAFAGQPGASSTLTTADIAAQSLQQLTFLLVSLLPIQLPRSPLHLLHLISGALTYNLLVAPQTQLVTGTDLGSEESIAQQVSLLQTLLAPQDD